MEKSRFTVDENIDDDGHCYFWTVVISKREFWAYMLVLLSI